MARRQSTALAAVSALFAITQIHAASRYWDGGNANIPANGDGNSDGASGTWSTGIANWDQGNGLPHVAWVNGSDLATIDGISQTLTLQNSTVTLSSDANLVFDNSVATNTFTFGGLAASSAGTGSNLALRNDASISIALTVGGNNSNTIYNGVLSAGGALIKAGSGTYHLIQFGSGPANANGFTLGTVPILAWNQTASLQVNGNYLDYMITAAGDTTPPSLSSVLPANNAAIVLADADLVATFDETIVAGTGSIELRKTSDGSLVESFDVASSLRLAFSTTQLVIQPTNVLPTGQSYYVLIPAGVVKDTSGNSYAGIIINTGWKFTVPVPAVLFTDTGSPVNPPWSEILPTLNVQSPDPGPVYGSLINVNNAAVEVGLYGNRPITMLGTGLRIHVACNTSTTNFANFTRWFQTDGNTHMLRVFVDDENTATSRTGTSSHTEAFMGGGWKYTDNMTYEWTARYTIARLQQGYTCFQLKNIDNDWAVALGMGTGGTLTVNNRTGTDKTVTNPDGSAKDFTGRGFDVRVIDDGLKYKVWIDGVLYASSSYSRPSGTTTFRWGMYFGANNLNPPADFNIVLVSGAQVKSWPGNLDTPTTTRTKANNTTNLNTNTSWVGNVSPGLYNQALWNSTVAAANTTTLASYQQWAGLKIANPGGTVTLNGSAILGLDDAGVDMSTATQDLDVNCPVQLTANNIWDVAAERSATFDGIISGYPGLTKNGGGTIQLNAANTYSGDTTLSAGTLVANNNSALGSGSLVFNGGTLSNTVSCTLGNDVELNSNAIVSLDTPQTLTLMGSIAGTGTLTKTGTGTLTLSGANTYTGATSVSAGTLAIGQTSALLSTPSLTLVGGTTLRPNLDGVVITAPITVASSGATATISAPTNNPGGGVVSTLTLDSVLAGSGNVTFSSSVANNVLSTVYLGAPNTYAGSTLLDTAGSSTASQIIVRLGTQNALPTNTVLTIDGQTGAGTGRFAELNLNGFNQQLAGLTNTPRNLRWQRVVNSNISAPATLTINSSLNHAFSGNLGSDTAYGSVTASAMPGSTNGNNFGLTKSGAGTFTLAGANSYTGGTTIGAGTLALGANNTLANTTDVSIDNATLNASTFTDTVGTLDITSTAKINLGSGGKLGFANSSAIDWTGGTLNLTGTFVPGSSLRFGTASGGLTPTQLALITAPEFGPFTLNSTGYLTASVVTGYTLWKTTNAPTGTPGDDFDGDGVANGIEYLLGGTASTNDHGKLPTLSTSGESLVFSFVRDQASIDGTTTVAIKVGTDLSSWPDTHVVPTTAAANNPGVTVQKDFPAAGKDTVTLTLPLDPGGKIFARLTMIP